MGKTSGKRHGKGESTKRLKRFRPNVALIILNSNGQVLIGKRAGTEVWQLPQGGIETDTLVEAALKEAHEELGISRKELIPLDVLNYVNTYQFKSPKDYGEAVYDGQTQRFIVLKFTGSQVDLSKASSKELTEVKWVNITDLTTLADPVRKAAYEKIVVEILDRAVLDRIR